MWIFAFTAGTDTVYIQVVTGHSLASVASVVATLLIALTVAFVSAWQLALCLLLMLPILSAVELIFNKFMMGSEQGAMEQYSSIAHVSESIRSMREVISFNLGQEAYGIYSNELMPIIGRKEQALNSVMCRWASQTAPCLDFTPWRIRSVECGLMMVQCPSIT